MQRMGKGVRDTTQEETMTATATRSNGSNGAHATSKLDAVVIGAGVAGLYQLFRLREQSLNVRAIDAGSSVGGTWYWNRYPGAASIPKATPIQYLFSEELYKGWSWSERFRASRRSSAG